MKQTLAFLLCLVMGLSLSAQTVKPQDAIFEDYIPLLQKSGNQAYSFDISDFLNETYLITFKIKEYTDSTDVKELDSGFTVPNRMMLNDFSESFQKRILADGTAFDAEKGIYTQSDKMLVGFYPSGTDSLKVAYLSLEGQGVRTMGLSLKPLKLPGNDTSMYYYHTRPFKVSSFEEGKFIPLVLLGSMWVDHQWGFLRFCGENEIDPEMSSTILKYLPHYYVIGVEIKKK